MVTALFEVHFSSRVAGQFVSNVTLWSRLRKLLWNKELVRVAGMFVSRMRCAGGLEKLEDDSGMFPPPFNVE